MIKKILIIGGDPNSVNSEIIFKSWKKLDNSIRRKIYLLTNYNLINEQFKKLKYSIKLKKSVSPYAYVKDNALKIIDVPLKYKNPFNVSKYNSSNFIKRSLELAHNLCMQDKNFLGLINCPVDKTLLKKKI